MFRRIGIVTALLMILAGTVFLLQGLRFLPSVLMYGKPEWVVIGVGMDVIGFVGLAWIRRYNRGS